MGFNCPMQIRRSKVSMTDFHFKGNGVSYLIQIGKLQSCL